MAKYKFNDDIPQEEAVALIRAVERYVNSVEYIREDDVLAIIGIEKVVDTENGCSRKEMEKN